MIHRKTEIIPINDSLEDEDLRIRRTTTIEVQLNEIENAEKENSFGKQDTVM